MRILDRALRKMPERERVAALRAFALEAQRERSTKGNTMDVRGEIRRRIRDAWRILVKGWQAAPFDAVILPTKQELSKEEKQELSKEEIEYGVELARQLHADSETHADIPEGVLDERGF